MKKNYLSEYNEEVRTGYARKDSYSSKDLSSTYEAETSKFFLLPEAYDIFSEIDLKFFSGEDKKQFDFISECLQYMRKRIIMLYNIQREMYVLPKLIPSQDTDGTITFNWVRSNFRAFFTFEGESGNYDAYCGIVVQVVSDAVSTQTRKLSKENYQSAIDAIIQLVVESL